MNRRVYIQGVGQTLQCPHPDKDMRTLCAEATLEAVQDANIELKDIQAVFVGQFPATTDMQFSTGQIIVDALGIAGAFAVVSTEGCTASGQAMHNAYLAIASGMYDVVLVLGFSKILSSLDLFDTISECGFGPFDMVTGTGYGRFDIHRYMEDNDVTEDDIDAFRETVHWYSARNPKSWFYGRKYLEKDEYREKVPYEFYPFRFGSWSVRDVEGAAAIILCSDKIAKSDTRIRIMSSVHKEESSYAPHSLYEPGTKYAMLHSRMVIETIKEALSRAKVDATMLDIFQPHEATIATAWSMLDSLGHPDIPLGKAPKWYSEGQAMPGGNLPCNTAGVFRSYNPGAICLQYTIENVLQLREDAGKRQCTMKRYIAACVVSPLRPWCLVIGRET
jgi:acetyl-CoA C-acetyltransferase